MAKPAVIAKIAERKLVEEKQIGRIRICPPCLAAGVVTRGAENVINYSIIDTLRWSQGGFNRPSLSRRWTAMSVSVGDIPSIGPVPEVGQG